MTSSGYAKIPNELLVLDAVPASVEDRSIYRFATTFNGYAYHSVKRRVDNCLLVGRYARERWVAEGQVPATATELRNALFYLQRSDHHSGGEELQSPFAAQLLEALRTMVRLGEVESVPDYERLPSGYDLQDRLEFLEQLKPSGREGGFTGERDDFFYVGVCKGPSSDEPASDGSVELWRFDSAVARGDFLARRWRAE